MNTDKWRTFVLPPNHKTIFPADIVYFDTETTFDPTLQDQIHGFRLGVLSRQQYVRGERKGRTDTLGFSSPTMFFDYLEAKLRQHRKIWVLAHNMDFDFGAVEGFKQLSQRGFKISFWAFAQNLFLLRAEKGKSILMFIDSGGYLTGSIDALGKRVGLAKLPMPDPSRSDTEWYRYCKRDVDILQMSFEAYMQFVAENDLGKLGLTGPAQAIAAYRHRFMRDKLVLHRIPQLVKAERQMYHGGRTEAFFIGDVPSSSVHYLDVNSMYPHMMKERNYPCEFLGVELNPSRSTLKQALERFEVGADVTLSLPEPAIPYISDKLLFPTGQFRSTLAGPEFQYCYDRGWCQRVHKLFLYRRGRPFIDYVDYFWEQRQGFKQSGDPVHEWLCKLMLNSLYGKFGQTNPTYETFENAEGLMDGIYYTVSSSSLKRETRLVLGNQIWLRTGEAQAKFTFYPLAAWVTSHARIYLWDLIKEGGRDHVYYCDTDSLFVDDCAFTRLADRIDGRKLGALGVKQSGAKLSIRGPKDYTFDDSIRIKGVPFRAEKLGESTYKYWTFERVRTRLRNGTENQVVQKTVTKTLAREYDKGVVTSSGWVIPHQLDLNAPSLAQGVDKGSGLVV